MIQVKKLLIICILIVSFVFISGCIDEEKINSKAGDSEPSTVSQINPKSDTNTQQEDNSLMDLEHFIDPQLKNVVIQSPDIEVVRFELIDNREYEDGGNYNLKILVCNNGDTPVWMDTPRAFYTSGAVKQQQSIEKNMVLLKSGERKWFGIHGGPTRYNTLALKNLDSLAIYSHRTVTPVISPELKSLDYVLFNRYGITSSSNFPVFDIHSIKYEEEDGWKYIIVGMKYEISYGSRHVFFKIGRTSSSIDAIYDQGIDRNFYAEQSGKIQYIKIPVSKSWRIEDVKRIWITV